MYFAAFVAVCIWGATQLRTEFNFEDYFVPGNSYVADAFEIRDRYWEGETFPAGVYLKNADIDYFANQEQLQAIGDELRDNKWVASSPAVDSWYESFQEWIDDSSLDAAQDSDEFYSQLRDFLDSDAGSDYTNNIIFEDDTRSQIISSEIEFFSIGGETADDQVNSMVRGHDTVTCSSSSLVPVGLHLHVKTTLVDNELMLLPNAG